ncbi:MAG: TolC family protein [Lentisphaerae bacterium]|nr:TolC family protein [Lentisphaerota bacterium]
MNFIRAVLPVFLFLVVWEAPAIDDLSSLVATAMEWNPRVRIAEQQLEQAAAERAELRGFFDPRLTAGAEHLDSVGGRREALLRAGAAAPVLPGVYLDAVLEERLLDQTGDIQDNDYENLIQSTARLRVNAPLLQDRGWRQWKLADLSAAHAYEMALGRLLAVKQEVRREVERQYLALVEAQALELVVQAATMRSARLLEEAEIMVGLQVLPEYQLYATRASLALRREDEASARQSCEIQRLQLLELLAAPTVPEMQPLDAEALLEWAKRLDLPEVYSAAGYLYQRGSYARILAQIESVRAARDLESDRLRSNLGLVLEATLQGEDPDSPIATGRYLSERNFGVMAGVVWSRPWGYRAERARVRIQEALLREQHEDLRQVEERVRTELAVAHQRFSTARERLRLVVDAAEASRRALESEDERFRLGEGRSRNVLDAQKDLTDTQKRQIVAALELLRAFCEFNYSSGYMLDVRPEDG